jgi:exosortase
MEPIRSRTIPSKIALTIKVAAVLIIILAIYHQDLTLIANEALQSEIMSYLLAIPILFTYLLYRKRKMIRAALSFDAIQTNPTPAANSPETTGAVLYKKLPPNLNQIIGALICLTAFLLYWHGSYTFYPVEYHMISLPIFISGIILVIFNANTLKALAFPIAMLLFLTPPPQEILNIIGSILSITSSESAYTILKATGFPVTLSSQYGTPVIQLIKPNSSPIAFTIDVACAGFYSLIGFIIFATFIAYITKAKLLKKTAIFLVGIPLMFALNVTRIIIIVFLGNQYGQETALEAFHLVGGWVLILTGSAILSTITEKIFKIQVFTSRKKREPCTYCNSNTKQHFCNACGKLLNLADIQITKKDLSKIAIIVILAFFILNIQVPVLALTTGPMKLNIRTLGGEQTILKMLPQIPNYTAVFVYRDTTFEEYSKQDASLIYGYTPNETTKQTIWVVIELAKAKAEMHPWEVCLITWQIAHGYQPQVIQLSQRDVLLLDNPPITARCFSFQDLKTNMIQIVLYWYESSFFNTETGMEREYTKISFIAFANNPQDVPSIEDQLLPFGKIMVDYWLPIKSWSLVALLISQNGTILLAITIAALAPILIYQTIKKQKQTELNQKAYKRLVSNQEKLILQTVENAPKQSQLTGSAITQLCQEHAEKPIQTDLLLEELSRAKEAGFIKGELANQDDEPILIWKTQTLILKQTRLHNFITKIQHIFAKPIHSSNNHSIKKANRR